MNCCRAEGHKKRRTAKRIGTARFRKIKPPQTAAAQALPDRTVFSLSQRPITSDACCHRLETLPAAGASKPLSFSLNVLGLNLQQRMPGDFLSLSGNLIGVVGLAWATFTGVSYLEVRKKIDEAVDAGEDPYELKVDRKKVRRAKPVKKAKSKKERTNRK